MTTCRTGISIGFQILSVWWIRGFGTGFPVKCPGIRNHPPTKKFKFLDIKKNLRVLSIFFNIFKQLYYCCDPFLTVTNYRCP